VDVLQQAFFFCVGVSHHMRATLNQEIIFSVSASVYQRFFDFQIQLYFSQLSLGMTNFKLIIEHCMKCDIRVRWINNNLMCLL
jgi:hypothetical protein